MKTIITSITLLLLIACNNSSQQKEETGSSHSTHTNTAIADGYADSVNTGLIKVDTMKSSPHRTAMLTVHGVHVHIEYGSPGVKGRIIWGGLVPYGTVWATGAHDATRIKFYKDVIINETVIAAGTYGLFTIPGQKEWTIILNKNYEQHLADEYDKKEDVLRIQVTPEEHSFMPRLTYAVEELPEKDGVVNILWEKIKIELPFKVK